MTNPDMPKAGRVMGTSGDEDAALYDAVSAIGLTIEVAERESRSLGAAMVATVARLEPLARIEQSGACKRVWTGPPRPDHRGGRRS